MSVPVRDLTRMHLLPDYMIRRCDARESVARQIFAVKGISIGMAEWGKLHFCKSME